MILTPAIKSIIIFTSIIFVLQLLSRTLTGSEEMVTNFLALSYVGVVKEFKVWTLFTYMFVHGNFWHLFLNMLGLFFFGTEVERNWGRKAFLIFYIVSGLGAGIIIFASLAVQAIVAQSMPLYITVGASGAIFAVLLGYSLLHSERQVTLLLFFVIPLTIKAKYILVLILGLSFVFSAFGSSNVSHAGHIGGIISGALFLLIYARRYPFIEAANQLKSWLAIRRNLEAKLRHQANLAQQKKQAKRRYAWRIEANAKKSSNLDEHTMNDNEIEEKIDELLELISAKGLRGLSDKEKQFLSRVSMLYRHKFPD